MLIKNKREGGSVNKAVLKLLLVISVVCFVLGAIVIGNDNTPGGIALLVIGVLFLVSYTNYNEKLSSKEASAAIEKRQTSQAYETIATINRQGLPMALPMKAILKKNELCHFSEFGELLEMRTVRYSSSGPSIRIRVAKGISIGGRTSSSSAIKELQSVAQGEFVITNKRVIFSGDNKSFEAPIGKIISVDERQDGISLHYGASTRHVRMSVGSGVVASTIIKKSVLEIEEKKS